MRTATKTFLISTTLLVGLAMAGPAAAAPITGSDTVSASVTSSNQVGSNLGSATQFGLGANQTFSVGAVGTGSFSVIPIGTTVPLSCTTLNLASLACIGFTSPTVGTFTPTSSVVSGQTATTLNLSVTGNFAPGSLFPGGSTSPPVIEVIHFTEAPGGPILASGTFTTVPEPLPISLIGMGLVGLLMLRSRRQAKTV